MPAREKYWEEFTPEQLVEKLGTVVEDLGRRIRELEREREAMILHSHLPDGQVMVPLRHNGIEFPWYQSHLLNRQPK